MNIEKFQKKLSWIQIAATGSIALGAIIISLGLVMMSIFSGVSLPAENRSNLDIYLQIILYIGVGVIFLGLGTSYYRIKKLSLDEFSDKNHKLQKSGQTILFDEMYDGKDIEFANKGYDTFSVKKIRLTGEHLQYDYSVLKYVEENKMILITEDSENYGGCIENGLQCIKLGQNPTVEEIEKGLGDLKKSNDSKE